MKKFVVTALLTLAVSLLSTDAQAAGDQVNNIKEQGSLLVYPLIDNLGSTGNRTVIEVTNRANVDVWLQGFMIVHDDSPPPYYFVKKDFLIHLTQKDPFYWDTSKPYDRVDVDDIRTQIQSFNGYKGFCFLWAVDNDKDRLEIEWNYLKGDAVVLDSNKAFQYNPIPHQGLAVVGDRVLNLDGVEYTMATSQVMVEGFAEGDRYPGEKYMGGKWVVCSLDIDFINSIQPEFDINIDVWNQYEVYQSRHLDRFPRPKRRESGAR